MINCEPVYKERITCQIILQISRMAKIEQVLTCEDLSVIRETNSGEEVVKEKMKTGI